jgi:23S rRNA (uracil1939-C5)-methyltransferase
VDEPTLVIEALAAGGDGVGRTPDGRVVFVPFTAPGDRVRVRIERERRRHAHARLLALEAPGPARVAPECPVFGRCGGCAWQHVRYETQLEAKAQILRDALARLGGIAWPEPIPVLASPSPYHYRGRARVVVEAGRVGYRERRSHAVCATATCPVLVPELEAELARLAADPPADPGDLELAAGEDGVRVSAAGSAAGGRLFVSAAGERIGFSAGVFLQANALLLGALAERVVAAAGGGAAGLELHAGAGFFTLALARRFARLVAVESNPTAAADLRRNLADAGQGHVEVWARRAEAVLDDAAALRPDAVVVDPPRTGLVPAVREALARLAPRLVYLSCDPATLARDLRDLGARGLRPTRLEAIDLFPQTAHVEALAVLERTG